MRPIKIYSLRLFLYSFRSPKSDLLIVVGNRRFIVIDFSFYSLSLSLAFTKDLLISVSIRAISLSCPLLNVRDCLSFANNFSFSVSSPPLTCPSTTQNKVISEVDDFIINSLSLSMYVYHKLTLKLINLKPY